MTTKTIIISTSLVTTTMVLMVIFMLWLGPGGQADKIVVIPPQSSVAHITGLLKTSDVIRSKTVFRVLLKLSGQDRRLKAGEYRFAPHQSITSVISKMVRGEVVHHAVTIPEGFTAGQIAHTLEQKGLCEANAFMETVHDSGLAKQLSVPADSLEGFLFPNTYQFSKGMSPRQLAERMVREFFDQLNPLLTKKGKISPEKMLQVVTMASIIEREARVDQERPLVASVFYNRLAQNKRLESCATVLYSQGRLSGSVTTEDLYFKSPYNTYRHRGLPPGPISNPGLASLQAALFPAETEYLFFVVRSDGEHVFSENFEDHKRAKWRRKKLNKKNSPSSGKEN